MTQYAIMRCKKLAKMGNVAASLKHAFRERNTPNADPEKTRENEHMIATSTGAAMGKLREQLPEKRRKDAVLCVEYVMTASPDWWKAASKEQQVEFFDRSLKWLADKYGPENLIVASVHRDETSPHMTAFVTPITKDGRLSAKEFIGNKAQMQVDQTTFAAAVRDLGLFRGIEGSKGRHQTIRAFYEALEHGPSHATIAPSAVQPRTFKPEGLVERLGIAKRVETTEQMADRLTKAVRQGYEPAVRAAAGAREMAFKAKEGQETNRTLRDRLRPFEELLGPLSKAGREKAVAIIKAVGQKLQAEEREQVERRKAEKAHKEAERRASGKRSRGPDLGR